MDDKLYFALVAVLFAAVWLWDNKHYPNYHNIKYSNGIFAAFLGFLYI